MARHSKWEKIHRQKGLTDAKRGTVFTKLANVISSAARTGGGDPEMNFKLKLAIEKAKAANMPKDNIERAVTRGTGEDSANSLETIFYEGFGPGGAAFVVECVTDSRNRTSAELKHLFSEYGGSLGSPNSVMWQFENVGVIGVASVDETLELELIDLGIKDVQRADNACTIICLPTDLQKVKEFLETKGIKVEFAELDLLPKNTVVVSDEATKKKIEDFVAELETAEYVNNSYTNARY